MTSTSLNLFHNPATPDLGCFVRQVQLDVVAPPFNVHAIWVPNPFFPSSRHQTYFRIVCGKTDVFQRLLVYKTPGLDVEPESTDQPDWILGGDYPPRPSEWVRYSPSSGACVYWFFGQHRQPPSELVLNARTLTTADLLTPWTLDDNNATTIDLYDNGMLTTIGFSDGVGDNRFNDLVVEVALVNRVTELGLGHVEGQKEMAARYAKEVLPRLRKSFGTT